MKDLISRQAAIDAISTPHGILYPIRTIEELPSAQQWIPVAERLPEDGKWYLFTDGASISVERYKADALDHFFPEGRWFSLEDAIAWMPLPESYKEGKQDE